ncbi:hydroxyacid dehydrogenase [Herbiconiux sp. P17]|uniref:hydroxyacid dehydrogenase n=1 Tax=Herbiconiux wuyangfengii TaxID=3342794 RepID=UPI0035B87AEB
MSHGIDESTVARAAGKALPAPDATDARPSAAFAMRAELPLELFDASARRRLASCLDVVVAEPLTDLHTVSPEVLAGVEVLITGWGSPTIDQHTLELMPRLRAVFHAAGTVKEHLTPAVWDRGILVTTAAAANAHPVAEYTLSMILLAGKGVLPLPADDEAEPSPEIGNYRRTVGIVGASTVGRQVIRLLAPFDLRVLVYDPVIDDDDPVLALATRVDLDELMRRSTIVSVHAPLLPQTVGMIGERELALLPDRATVINTARAPIIDQDALQAAVEQGRVRAILDVTDPEPLPASHPLRRLDGILTTPHVAGALGNELLRLGETVVHEVELFARGAPPAYPVLKEDLAAMA